MDMKIRIGILGAAGRMGQMVAREILSRQDGACVLAAAVDHDKSWALGRDSGEMLGAGPCGVKISADKEGAFAACDVLIDFTTPDATERHAALAHLHKKALVVGTTGLSMVEEAALEAAAKNAPVLHSANMSVGVNLLLSLVEQAAALLGPEYDIEIFEAHHRLKTDAPSGTALALGQAAAKGRKISLNEALVPARFGQIGPRVPGSIGISVFRGGDVVGDHAVTFAGTGERIELSHKASDRSLFAKGALHAALWLHNKPAGLYAIRDVLAL